MLGVQGRPSARRIPQSGVCDRHRRGALDSLRVCFPDRIRDADGAGIRSNRLLVF